MIKAVLAKENIILNAGSKNMNEAILACGQILIDNGYVKEEYIDDMLKKEEVYPSYIGNNIAIPHGFTHSSTMIENSGVSVLQIPEGFETDNGEIVYLVFGIAGIGDEHIKVLGKLALACSEMEVVEKIRFANNKSEIIQLLGVNE